VRLADVLAALRAVAPERLAASWDRVGLHLGSERQRVRRALLCIDLTEPVMAEAVAGGCELIVAYHPPIFEPLRRLTDRTWKERVVLEAARRRVAVYSPHTALDAARGGMTDWLCDGLGKHGARVPIVAHVDGNEAAPIERPGRAPERPAADDAEGAGRVHHLARPVSAATLVARVKQRLGLAHVAVAVPIADNPHRDSPATGKIQSIAVCPGAGGSLFEGAPRADAYFTGEMQHHQVLDMTARGRLVILAGHTNTERPYLPAYRERLIGAGADRVEWLVSAADRAPFVIR
jgi:dinuclear metal center YbgI/SA1388 family protein